MVFLAQHPSTLGMQVFQAAVAFLAWAAGLHVDEAPTLNVQSFTEMSHMLARTFCQEFPQREAGYVRRLGILLMRLPGNAAS